MNIHAAYSIVIVIQSIIDLVQIGFGIDHGLHVCVVPLHERDVHTMDKVVHHHWISVLYIVHCMHYMVRG